MTAATHEAHAQGAPAERPKVEILPVKGLPIVALVVVGIVWAIASDSRWALTWFHVAGGGLWTGIDLFFGLVLGPIIGRMALQGRIELTARLMPKMVLIIPTLVTMTLASGFQLARLNGYLDTSYPRHGWVVASMIVVAVMAVLAIGLLEPANLAVLFEMRKPQPDGLVIQKLMKRFIYCSGIIAAMQIATLVIMTKLAS